MAGAGGKVLPALVQQAISAILPVSNLHAFKGFHMGIALLDFSALFQSLNHLTSAPPITVQPPRTHTLMRPVWASRRPACSPQSLKTATPALRQRAAPASPALRVLRVTESDQRVKGAGRMVISGRMADVCAELDRLAALETAQSRV